MKKNDEFPIEITDITSDGSGIGKVDGMTVFVPLTAVGDTAKVKILKVKKTYAYGKAEEWIVPSPDRIENDCPVFSRCGGCVFRHITYEAECTLKERRVQECVKRIGGIDLPPQPFLPAPNATRYRNKAQYPVAEEGRLGFYAFHSHRVVPCEDCFLQPAVFAKIGEVFTAWVNDHNISVYDEQRHSGCLRHFYIRYAEETGELLVCAVINGKKLPFSNDLIERLRALLGDSLQSVQVNYNCEKTNVILGKECQVIYGEPFLTDILCGVRVRLSPHSFYQVNHAATERLYQKVKEYASPAGKTVLDLYCGVGTIGLSMAREADRVIGVEIVPQAVEDARFNAENNGIQNAEFFCADAADAAESLAARGIRADVVIVDPPRKGLNEKLIETITKSFCPERVVYVSCDPATMARDIKCFSENGYSLKEYTPVDLFPRTAHVETVALIARTGFEAIERLSKNMMNDEAQNEVLSDGSIEKRHRGAAPKR